MLPFNIDMYGCHIGRAYAGAFGYADDIALLAPSLSSFKRMIKICEVYDEEYCILFNHSKSKLLTNVVPNVKLYGESVELVDNEKHLGNNFSTKFINVI